MPIIFTTYVVVQELRPLRRDVEHDAVDGSGQRHAAHKKCDEDDVGKDRSEVRHLAGAGHALPEGEEEHDVAESQAAHQAQDRPPQSVVDGLFVVQNWVSEKAKSTIGNMSAATNLVWK